MLTAESGVAGYVAGWRPVAVAPQAAVFARDVIVTVAPAGRDRAKNLLWAAARLADYAIGIGLDPVPQLLLHPSVIERFTAHAPGLSGPARRTLRTNLRFIGRAAVPRLHPTDAPLPRERAKAPYSTAEIDGYLALADAQPTSARRMRAAGLICLGAGAGLIRSDLRVVRGSDVICRSGGVVVSVRGRRPRVVPVLAGYQQRLVESAAFAGDGLVTGGTDPGRKNITNPLVCSLAGGAGLPRLDTSRGARDLAGRGRRPARPGHVSARGRDQLLAAARRPGRRSRARRRGDRSAAARGGTLFMIPPPVLEGILDSSGVAPRIEALLPVGVRVRQLTVRTLILGMMLTQADHRPAHLTRVHQALTTLGDHDQRRLGVIADWKTGPHLLTYRQTERTFGLVTAALAKHEPDSAPSPLLADVLDDLLEASIPADHKHASGSLAVDWTDLETFSRPPPRGSTDCADPEASWGHRTPNLPGPKGELFYGYYLSAATMTTNEHGPPVPELARRITLTSCRLDPVRAMATVLTRMPDHGVPLGDILTDSGYAHRNPDTWAIPLRAASAQLIQDLHPHDRGPQGTHHGAVIANGNLYCPATPTTLLQLGPLARDATAEQTLAHDTQAAELARHKLGRISADDADGYHRVGCPAALGKIRCPLRGRQRRKVSDPNVNMDAGET